MKKLILLLILVFCFATGFAQQDSLMCMNTQNTELQFNDFMRQTNLDVSTNQTINLRLGNSNRDDNIKIGASIAALGVITVTSISYYTQPDDVRKETAMFHYSFLALTGAVWLTIQVTF